MRTRKLTVYIVDDEPASALARASAFFEFTSAPMAAGSSAEMRKLLAATAEHPGMEIRLIEPRELRAMRDEKLDYGIVLIDVNWRNYRGDDPAIKGAPPEELESYGIKLAEELLKRRHPESHLHLILYSATRISEVVNAYTEWTQYQHLPNVWQIISGEGTPELPTIQRHAWTIYVSLCKEILSHCPSEVIPVLKAARESYQCQGRLLRMEHLIGNATEERLDGFHLVDLATPFLQRFAGCQANRDHKGLRTTGSTILKEWHSLYRGRVIEFELPEQSNNLAILFLKALLRYQTFDHLDALLEFRTAENSPFFDPAGTLVRRLEKGMHSAQQLSLRHIFARIPQIRLGTELDKDPNKISDLPIILRDRKILNVKRRATVGQERPALWICKNDSGTGFRLELAEGVTIINRLWTVREFLRKRRNNATPEEVIHMMRLDPQNFKLVRLAEEMNLNVQRCSFSTNDQSLLQTTFRNASMSLENASIILKNYRDCIINNKDTLPQRLFISIGSDLLNCSHKLQSWKPKKIPNSQ